MTLRAREHDDGVIEQAPARSVDPPETPSLLHPAVLVVVEAFPLPESLHVVEIGEPEDGAWEDLVALEAVVLVGCCVWGWGLGRR